MGWDPVTAAAERTARFAREARRRTVVRTGGVEVVDARLECSFHLTAGVFLSVNYEAVRAVLPSPRLHPVRWTPGRSLIQIEAMDWQWRLGSLPPVRCVDVSVDAVVSYGRRPAPPVLPILTESLPLGHRYGVGMYFLARATTNRVSAQVFSGVLGVETVLADVREERGPDRSRFTVTDGSRLVFDIDVHIDPAVRPAPTPENPKIGLRKLGDIEGYRGYGVRDGGLLGWAITCHDVGGTFTFGRGAGDLELGEHPLADLVRSLDPSARVVGAGIRHGGGEVYDGPVHLGPATARQVIEHTPGKDVLRDFTLVESGTPSTIEQLPADLPFDPRATVTVEPVEE